MADSGEVLCSKPQNVRAVSAERPCSVREASVLRLQGVCALSPDCLCSVRASVYYLLPTHKVIDLQVANRSCKQDHRFPCC